MVATTRRAIVTQGDRLQQASQRLDVAGKRAIHQRRDALQRLDRMRKTLGYEETLKRGFAVVRGPDGVLTTANAARQVPQVELQFADGTVSARPDGAPPKPSRKSAPPAPEQKDLF